MPLASVEALLVGVEDLHRQDGSEDLLREDLAAGLRVDDERGPEVVRTEVGVDVAAVRDGRAVAPRPVDEALDPLDVLEVDVGADLGVLVARVALADLRRPLAEALGEGLGDAALHEQPRARQAHLAGVVVLLDGEVDGEIEVGVVEDHRRALAAELEGARHQVVGGRAGDHLRGGNRSGEADAGHVRVGRQRRAGLGAEALHDVEDARGQAGLVREVGEVRGGQRGPLRRLEDDGVAGRECRADAPRGEHQGRVPGRDDHRDAGGVPGHVVGVTPGLELGMAQPVDRVVGEEPDVHGDAGHDPTPMRPEQRAVVEGLDLGELLDVRLDGVGEAEEDLAPLLRAHPRPRRERGAGCGDGRVRLGLSAARDLAEQPSVDRRDVVERLGRGDAPATDPVPGVDVDSGDADRAHGAPTGRRFVGTS